ncbi:MAG: hypothetical protein VKP57_11890 [Candidatus Sericytochromatia bacterium]|nr:hypothetical protein [Candidatus Sericytochromatia bacterium]
MRGRTFWRHLLPLTLATLLPACRMEVPGGTAPARSTAVETPRRLVVNFDLQRAAGVPVPSRLTVGLYDNGANPGLGRWSATETDMGPLSPATITGLSSPALNFPPPGLPSLAGELRDRPLPFVAIDQPSRWLTWFHRLSPEPATSSVAFAVSDLEPDPDVGEGAMLLLALVSDERGTVLGQAHRWLSSGQLLTSATLALDLAIPVEQYPVASAVTRVRIEAPEPAFHLSGEVSELYGPSDFATMLNGAALLPEHVAETDAGALYFSSGDQIVGQSGGGFSVLPQLAAGLPYALNAITDLEPVPGWSLLASVTNVASSSDAAVLRLMQDGSRAAMLSGLTGGGGIPPVRALSRRQGQFLSATADGLLWAATDMNGGIMRTQHATADYQALAHDGRLGGRIVAISQHQVSLFEDDGTLVAASSASPGFRDGPLASARFDNPVAACRAPWGGVLVADRDNAAIRWIDLENGLVSTWLDRTVMPASLGGSPLLRPIDISVSANGRVLILDSDGLSPRLLVTP